MTFDHLRHDLRWALRSLARAPTLAALAVLTLALAIGVNSAIFTMVGSVYFVDTGITDTDTFFFLSVQHPERCSAPHCPLSAREYLAYREGVPAFESLAAARRASGTLIGADEPLEVFVAEATPTFWDVWGTPPLLGRGFRPAEASPGAETVVVLSHGFWQRRFGGDEDIIGRRVQLDGANTTIVGVMPPVYELGDLTRIEIWTPLRLNEGGTPPERRDLGWVSGRLAPGATLAQARQQAGAVAQRLAEEVPPSERGWVPNIYSYRAGIVGEIFWPLMTLLSIAVGLVMLMACSNVGAMMLARGTARSREIAVRAALGAGRGRIIRGLLLEGVVLSVVAAALGIAITRASLASLAWLAGPNASIGFFFRMLKVDHNVLAFTVLIAAAAPLLFSLLPALHATRGELVHSLKAGAGASAGVRPFRVRRLLVAGQVAMALTLMVVAGVTVRGMLGLYVMDLGYDAGALLTMRVSLPETKYASDEQRLQFFRDAEERIDALAELESGSWVSRRPMAESAGNLPFRVRGRALDDGDAAPSAGLVVADATYLDLVNARLVRGRMFSRRDAMAAMPVALVNQEAVTRYWPDQDPLGTYVQLEREADEDRWIEVVGVVTTEQQPDPPPRPLFYVPFAQNPRRTMALVTRPRATMDAAADAIRRAVWQIDPDQPISDVRTMQQIHFDQFADGYAISSMLLAFACFALLLAAAGIYGVMSVLVAQRTRELGIRKALGADRRAILSMVLRGAAMFILGGAVAGVLGGFALATVLASAINVVEAMDPPVYAAVAITLIAVAFASLWLPTRRATRVDPLVALRAE